MPVKIYGTAKHISHFIQVCARGSDSSRSALHFVNEVEHLVVPLIFLFKFFSLSEFEAKLSIL